MLSVVVTGRECDVVILTTVRSLLEEDIPDHPSHSWVTDNLGFVTDEHLMNVAITRAKEALCIIGRYYGCVLHIWLCRLAACNRILFLTLITSRCQRSVHTLWQTKSRNDSEQLILYLEKYQPF